MKCLRCGSRAVATTYGERRCLMFGWEPPPVAVEFVPVTVAARRCAVSVRTIRRWIDAGAVNGVMPTGSGRVRQVDVVSVAAYIVARWNRPRTCESVGKRLCRPVSSVRAASTDAGAQPNARAPTIMRRGTAYGRLHDGDC